MNKFQKATSVLLASLMVASMFNAVIADGDEENDHRLLVHIRKR